MIAQEGFKTFARAVQPRILESHGPWTDRQKELLANLENLTDTLVLGWEARWVSRTAFWCALWVSDLLDGTSVCMSLNRRRQIALVVISYIN